MYIITNAGCCTILYRWTGSSRHFQQCLPSFSPIIASWLGRWICFFVACNWGVTSVFSVSAGFEHGNGGHNDSASASLSAQLLSLLSSASASLSSQSLSLPSSDAVSLISRKSPCIPESFLIGICRKETN